jgi:23S rRNA pseudouridine1911/1915/1917 synthase
MRVIYQDEHLIAYDKPAGINCQDFPGRVHRLDKDTSGVFLVAKNNKSLELLQKEFKERNVDKKYIALVWGHLKKETGEIENYIGRSPADGTKQKIYLPGEPGFENKRRAITRYKLIKRFKDYDLIEVEIDTGRKHQIRVQFSFLGHPIAGDKKYSFKRQPCPKGLERQFLHAAYIKIKIPGKGKTEIVSELPSELQQVLKSLDTN